ncbi:MAG: glycosyltransferase family 2 protein [Lautropia sp.]|nr:glycosyltransferase family 2 protein [Lautropia sp.]
MSAPAVIPAGAQTLPSVSLIISTYQRPLALDQVLASVAAQTVQPLQVLVADDGSGLETARVVATWREHFGERLVHCWQPDEGFRLSASRNRAIRDARGDLLIFVDGDCLMRPDFIATHQRLAESGYAVAGNRVLLSQALTRRVEARQADPVHWRWWAWVRAWVFQQVNRPWGLLHLPGQWWRRWKGRPWKRFKTCNVALWREDMLTLNGFEEEIVGWGFEDTDLVLRWFNLGGRLKSGRFGTTVLHLWHPEAARDAAERNEIRARQAGRQGAITAVQGLAQRSASDRYDPPRGR